MAKITTTLFGDLALLPYQAEAPVSETLEYLTDVLEANDATEERFKMRSKPRQVFNYSIPLAAWKTAEAFNTEYGALRKDWAVPVWTEAQRIGTVAEGLTEIECNTSLYDLRPSSLAMLYGQCGQYQVIEIDEVLADSITLLAETIEIKGAYLMPVRIGWIKGNVEKPTNGYNAKSSVEFTIDDTSEIDTTEPTQYLGDDIYYQAPLMASNALQASLTQQQETFDGSLGPIARRSSWDRPRYSKPWRWLLETPSEIRQYKEFLQRRCGKFRQFWFPTFENNLRITNIGNIVSIVKFEADSFIEYASLRKHVAFESNGVWYPRGILSAMQISPTEVQLTLDAPLNIQTLSITRASYLGLHRLDTDRIEFDWSGGGIVETSVQIIEISP